MSQHVPQYTNTIIIITITIIKERENMTRKKPDQTD